MNDGLRTNVFLKHRAHIIACAVLQLGASKLGERVFILSSTAPHFGRSCSACNLPRYPTDIALPDGWHFAFQVRWEDMEDAWCVYGAHTLCTSI